MKPKVEFEEIVGNDENLHKLEHHLSQYLPRAHQMLNICKLAATGSFPSNVLSCTFYKIDPADTNKDEMPFVVCIQNPTICSKTIGVFVLPPHYPTTEMNDAFDKLLNWNEDIAFLSCPADFYTSVLTKLILKHCGNLDGLCVPGSMYAIPNELAIQIQAPSTGLLDKPGFLQERYTLRSLTGTDLPRVLKNWHYSTPEAEEMITKLLPFLPTCGLFVEGVDGTEELACHLLASTFGLCNILYTEEKHRGKGYAQKVIQWLAKELAVQKGVHPLIETEEWNVACQKCIKRNSFERKQNIVWYWYKANVE